MKNLINFLNKNKCNILIVIGSIIVIAGVWYGILKLNRHLEKIEKEKKHNVEIIWQEGVRTSNFAIHVTKLRVEQHEYFVFKHSNCPNVQVIRGTLFYK